MSMARWAAVVREGAAQVPFREVAPVNPLWVSPQALALVADLAATLDLGVHTHLLEARWQKHGPVEGGLGAFFDAGLVGERFSAAHAVWADAAEIAQVAQAGAQLVHCPMSNRRLSAGRAPLRRWLDAGVRVAIGLDSITGGAPDMFAVLRAARDQAAARREPVGARDLLAAATIGGAARLGQPGWGGVIEPGARADLVGLSLPTRAETVADQILDRATRRDVERVWAAGRLVVERSMGERPAVSRARRNVADALAVDQGRRHGALTAMRQAVPVLRRLWSDSQLPQDLPEGGRP
jgi:cytosine/adenosine deaminase-related metal-dependent hydrolase